MGNDESVPTLDSETRLVTTDERAMVTDLSAHALLAQAIDAKVGIDTLERLIALRDRLKAEASREAFFSALAVFQGECPVIVKRQTTKGSAGGYSYRYAPLDDIMRQVSPLLEKHGFSYTADTRQADGQFTVISELHHVAGYTKTSEFTVPIDKGARMNDTQKVGAARTYGLRYGFCNALGIITGDEDTDANESNAEEIPLPRRTTSPESSTGKGGDTRSSAGASSPSPARDAAARISAAQHRSLEVAIKELAESRSEPTAAVRQRLHSWMQDELHVSSFNLLTREQLQQLHAEINRRFA